MYFVVVLFRIGFNTELIMTASGSEKVKGVEGGCAKTAASKGFSIADTECHVKVICRDGEWGDVEVVTDPHVTMHIGATALHYGQSVFEGLKAFQFEDGSLNLFRPLENLSRMNSSAERLMMPQVPEKVWMEAITTCVRKNASCLGEYSAESTKSMYVRPFLFGSGPQLAVTSADEYTFIVFVTPVGTYYADGPKPVSAIVSDLYDRAAPLGVGSCKAAGNYAPSILPEKLAKAKGHSLVLYLDARERRYVEEFGTSNFIAISNSGSYVTPDSPSILPSITNKSLIQLCETFHIPVERRKISMEEVVDGNFREAAACGTAVVITPVSKIEYNKKSVVIGEDRDTVGPVLEKLYNTLTGIQKGAVEDTYGWMVKVH